MSHEDKQVWLNEWTPPEGWDEKARLRATNAELLAALKDVRDEVYWFVSRQKDLAQETEEGSGRTWADVLDEDISIARAAIAKAEASK